MNVSYQALRVLREFLIAEEPKCGAEIMRELKAQGGVAPGGGTLYPLLTRLVDEGWVEFVETLPSPNQPAAHFYRMAPAGRAAFLDMLVRLTIPSRLWRTPDA